MRSGLIDYSPESPKRKRGKTVSDISVTAASVQRGPACRTDNGTTGSSNITAGMSLAKNTSGLVIPAKGDTANNSRCIGIALHASLPGQPIEYAVGGQVIFNAALTAGHNYCVSGANAGGIAPYTDLTTGNFVTTLGTAISATALRLAISASGVSQ
jgi:hypothetical protein